MSSEQTQTIQVLGQQLVDLAKEATRLAQQEVNDIIDSGDDDMARIEQQLDRMLDFAFDADMLALYKQLCRHYFNIDPVATSQYVHAYREMWDTPSEPEGKNQA